MKIAKTLALLSFLAVACGRAPEPPPPPAEPAPEAPAAEPPAPPAEPPPAAAFTWTGTPRLDDVPAGPIRGELDGRPFEAKWVGLQPDTDRTWRLTVADKAPTGDSLGLIHGGRYAGLFLSEPPEAGARYERAMALDGKGFLHLRDAPRVENFGNRHGECAHVLELTAWDVKDWDPEGQMGQLAGTAAGRLALTCKAHDGAPPSFLAGTFEGATVRYMGVPWWVPEDVQKKFLSEGRMQPKR
jgi:hypothetical protein